MNKQVVISDSVYVNYKSRFMQWCSDGWDLGAAIGTQALAVLIDSQQHRPPIEALLSPDEAARLCNVSHATLRRHKAPHVLIGGQRRYERDRLIAWWESMRVEAETPIGQLVELRSRRSGGAS